MYCQKCKTQNGTGAQFCGNCGAHLFYSQEVTKKESNVSGVLLFVYILIFFFVVLVELLVTTIMIGITFWEAPWKYILGVLYIVRSISVVLPAVAIKNKPLKIIGIIFAVILASYLVWRNLTWLGIV